MRLDRINEILKSRKVWNKVLISKPEMIILHVVLQDLGDGKSYEDVLNTMKQYSYKILEQSKSKLCISLIIPTFDYPALNKRIINLNKAIGDFVSVVRSDHKYADRIYTQINNKIARHIGRTVGPNGAFLKLSSRGHKLLWLKLRDALDNMQGNTGHYAGHALKNKATTRNTRKYE